MTSYVNVFTGDIIQPTDVSYNSFQISADLILFWPLDGSPAGNYAARIMEVDATVSGRSVFMPAANETSVGTDALFVNTGALDFTVKDSAGGTIVTVAAGESQYIYVTNNTSIAGSWGVVSFGSGASSASASALAGYGLKAITTTLNQSHPVVTTSSSGAITATSRASALVWTGGVGTLTLSSAATLGNDWFVMVRNGGSGLLTIATTGGNLINGSASLSMQIGDSAFICCSGSAFFTVGFGQQSNFAYSQLVLPVTSGTVVLTPAQAQNTVIKVTGTLTGPVTIQVPAAVQVYFIINEATGFPVTFTTGVVGGANATLTSSQQATLVCDATNLFNATTVVTGALAITLLNGSLASPSLSFASETSTGMYRPSAGQIAWGILGFNRMLLEASGLTIQGSGTFTGGISGGVFT